MIVRLTDFSGWNAPAAPPAIAHLEEAVGALPADVLKLYRDHDGSRSLPRRGNAYLPARLLPVNEAIKTTRLLADLSPESSAVGHIAWLWYDENSNYAGVYADGPIAGYVVKLDHESPCLAPAYRSTGAFLQRLLPSAPGVAEEGQAAFDIPMIPSDLPEVAVDTKNVQGDRELVSHFSELYESTEDEDVARLFALCAICLTPVADTASAARFFTADDIWIPEAAVILAELRRCDEVIPALEKLAVEGYPNGDSAAMRCLVRLRTNSSRSALVRLKQRLEGQKLEMLQMWMEHSHSLQPPKWP